MPFRLVEHLVKEGLVAQAALDAALAKAERDEPTGAALVRLGVISEDQLLRAIEAATGAPRLDLDAVGLGPELANGLPFAIAERTRCVPVRTDSRHVYVAAVDPSNVVAWDELAALLGKPVRTFTISERQLQAGWRRVYGDPLPATTRPVKAPSGANPRPTGRQAPAPVPQSPVASSAFGPRSTTITSAPRGTTSPATDTFDVDQLSAELAEVEVLEEADEEVSQGELVAGATDSPAVKLVNGFIYEATERGASDIHIQPLEHHTLVRYRIDGELRDRVELPRTQHRVIVSRIKIMAHLDIAERRLPQDGRVRMRIGQKAVDLRISTLPTAHGEKVVIRVLGGTLVKESVDQLGMRSRDLEVVKRAVSTSNGMILVTGPTGSGKTTTLYTILRQLNEPGVNITTAEDPIEYEQARIAQVQVRPEIGFTFAAALRSFLRQDPDIIMVGEIRDLETAEIAIKAALTGHLVLSTLHTNDSVWTIARLLDMGVPPFLVGASVRCVIAQRLVRKLCPQCREPGRAADYEAFKRAAPTRPRPKALFSPRGCDACGRTGFKGRLPVFEVLSLDKDEVKAIVTAGAKREELVKVARADGLATLLDRAIEHVEEGTTTLEEAWASCAM